MGMLSAHTKSYWWRYVTVWVSWWRYVTVWVSWWRYVTVWVSWWSYVTVWVSWWRKVTVNCQLLMSPMLTIEVLLLQLVLLLTSFPWLSWSVTLRPLLTFTVLCCWHRSWPLRHCWPRTRLIGRLSCYWCICWRLGSWISLDNRMRRISIKRSSEQSAN